MAIITLPSNPVDGQKVTSDNRVFTYDADKSRWSSRAFQIIGRMPIEVNFGNPNLALTSNNVNLDSLGQVFYIKYNIDDDVDVRFTSSGLGNANVQYFSTNNTIRVVSDATEFNGTINVIASNRRRTETKTISVRAKYGVDGSLAKSLTIPQPSGGASGGHLAGFDTDGTYVYIGDNSPTDNNGNVKIYDLETGTLQSTLTNPNHPTTSTPPRTGINYDQFGASLAIKPDGTKIAVAAPYEDYNYGSLKVDAGVIHIIDVATGTREVTLRHSPDIQLINSPNNEYLMVEGGTATNDYFIARNTHQYGRNIAIDWSGNVLSSYGWSSTWRLGSTSLVNGTYIISENNTSHPSQHRVRFIDNFDGSSFSATRELDASAQIQPGNSSTMYRGGIGGVAFDDTYVYLTKDNNLGATAGTIAEIFLYDVNTLAYVGSSSVLGQGWNQDNSPLYYGRPLGFNTKSVSSVIGQVNGYQSSAIFLTDNATLTTTRINPPDAPPNNLGFGSKMVKLTNTSFLVTNPGADKIYIYE